MPIAFIVRFGASGARLSRGGFGPNLTKWLERYNKAIWAPASSVEVGVTG